MINLSIIAPLLLLISNHKSDIKDTKLCSNDVPSAKIVTHVFPRSIIPRVEPDAEDIVEYTTAIPFPKGIWDNLFGKICKYREENSEIFKDFRPRIVIYKEAYVRGEILALEYPDAGDYSRVRGILGNKQIYVDNLLVRSLLDKTRLK